MILCFFCLFVFFFLFFFFCFFFFFVLFCYFFFFFFLLLFFFFVVVVFFRLFIKKISSDRDCLPEVFEQSRGGTPAHKFMAIHDRRHLNTS